MVERQELIDKMTTSLISFDSTSIHELRLCGNTFSMLGFIFLVKKNCVKIVDFGQEYAENRIPSRSVTIDV